ncbi:MAG: methyltransferase domain-containing protein [Magnetococcales bacterium]|nr:methyltransferase domain-containing protein [Magnetococcales bacterium]
MSANCRLCQGDLFAEPVIELPGMPKAAQFYPMVEEFRDDSGITLCIFRCVQCGLIQLNQEPVSYYKEVITAASLSPKARDARLREMREFVAAHDLIGKSILELGSGNGGMLDVMNEAGMVATGLEASAGSVRTGQELGRRMIAGYLNDFDRLPGAPYDAFITLNFLEHVPELDRMIQKIYSNTAAGAVGFVTVPNLEYLLASRCYYEFVADHVSYFTTATLRFAFEKNGFEVLDCHTINNDNDILAIVRKRQPLSLAGQYREVEELIGELRRIVGRYQAENRKVAVWGAGHRTLALLALANLTQIEFVIDSAPFKQGRFTPVLHKLIVAPSTLLSAGVGLVLVMVPGIYPAEVLNTIQTMKLDLDVAILRGNRIDFITGK